MAATLGPKATSERFGSLVLLDDAVRLLRRASPAALACHPIGSLPLAFSLVAAWNMAADPHTTAAAWARGAIVPVLMLVWMNCWRAVYAAKLWEELCGSPIVRWTPVRITRLAAIECWFGTAKLIVLPLAALVQFPLAETVAVYRYLPILATQTDLGPRQMVTRARQLAARNRAQGWAILPILLFLQVVVDVNLAIVLAVLPQVVRILTGYESAFSRSGIYFVSNPFFLVLVLVVSWMSFDPFVQAVYTVRYFRAESVETGQDLRTGLRRLRAPALAAAALALLAALPAHLRAEVSPQALRASIEEAVQAPEYDWRLPPQAASGTPWIARLTDRMVSAGRGVGRAIGRAVDRFFRWLDEKLRGLLPTAPPGGAPATDLHWIMYVMIGIALAAVAGVAWQKRRAPRIEKAPGATSQPVRLDAVDLPPDLLQEETWTMLAERSLSEQNYRFALRAFYLAGLAWLGRLGVLTIYSGKTNQEYQAELARRMRAVPQASGLFASNVAAFECAWYGEHQVTTEDVENFCERTRGLKNLLQNGTGAAV